MNDPRKKIAAGSTRTENGCWEWNGYRSDDGYPGRIRINGTAIAAHRASYMVFIGPIPTGMAIDHLCFNPSCVNPAHLRVLTQSENSRNKDPNKPPPWMASVAAGHAQRAVRRQRLSGLPVIDFEEAS